LYWLATPGLQGGHGQPETLPTKLYVLVYPSPVTTIEIIFRPSQSVSSRWEEATIYAAPLSMSPLMSVALNE